MAIIKCKMCGGDIEVDENRAFGTCEYCGSRMTLPKVDDEQRAAAFNRGNYFRRIGEFDKALNIYEQIVREDDADAEAHWCCTLCRFGIEYVEDPASGKWLPTCHRASFDSILEDVDYLAALEHSVGRIAHHYRIEAERIAQVQRDILRLSKQEKPFDVFICYKEADGNGERTKDSVLAQEIYYQLTDKGLRVFFARITLEDKPGTQYEPYIFAALNSAKVMVVVCTSAEYANAVWVKNEWSRFLMMMKNDRSKLLIPCYRDMNPYDLPDRLAALQAYDIGRIGFMQDLIRGVEKVLGKSGRNPIEPEKKEREPAQNKDGSTNRALLTRGYMALEDEEWEKADKYFERVLDNDAECAKAYMGQFLARKRKATLNAYFNDILKNMKETVPSIFNAQPVDRERIAKVKALYYVQDFLSEQQIEAAFAFKKSYTSNLAILKSRYEAIKKKHDEDKQLMRAVRFARGAYSEEVKDAFSTFDAELKQIIDESERKQEQALAQINEEYAQHLDETEKRLEQQYLQALEEKRKREKGQRHAKHMKTVKRIVGIVVVVLLIAVALSKPQ